MKKGSDNYRFSAVLDIIKKLQSKGKRILIYEPMLQGNNFWECEVIKDKEDFLSSSDLIVANRISSSLKNFEEKVFTRDIYNRD
jgi:Predicted UDP-glucose 6-dehydrogenase